MPSVFSKIINGELPSYKVAEDSHFYAFLDIEPNAIGHTLCVPKKEVDKLFQLDEATYAGLMQFSRKVGLVLGDLVPCKRVGMAVIGLEVPHVHVHLIPLNSMEDMVFNKSVKFKSEKYTLLAQKLNDEFKRRYPS